MIHARSIRRGFQRCSAPACVFSIFTLSSCGPDPLGSNMVDWDRELHRADQRQPADTTRLVRPGKEQTSNSSSDSNRNTGNDVTSMTLQEDEPLSVEQAVVLALRSNRGLAVEQLQPEIAGNFAEIERSIFDPTIFADFELSRDRQRQVSRATGETFDTEGEDERARVGVQQLLPTGTEIELDARMQRVASDRTPTQFEPRIGVGINQALLRGAGPAANLVRLEQARMERTASEFELRGFATNLVAEVEVAYWQYVLASREIAIFEQAMEVAEQLMTETQQRIEVGALPQTEAAVVEAEVALRRQDLINARSRMQQARLELVRLITPGKPEDWGRWIDVPDEPADPIVPDLLDTDVAEHIVLARQYRPELNEARVRLDQNRLEVVHTRNGLLPRLDLFIAFGKTGFADSFGSSISEMNAPTYDLLAGLRFEYPLGNRDAEARHRQAMLIRNQAYESIGNLEMLTELDVRKAYLELDRARQQIDASRATRQLREQTLEAEVIKLREGISTNFLVAQAQRDLLASQIDEVSAGIQLKIAIIELYRLDGTLLTRRGIIAPGGQLAGR